MKNFLLITLCSFILIEIPNTAVAEETIHHETMNILPDVGFVNPLRGFYEWHQKNVVPQNEVASESYERLSWTQLEKNEGEYDFSPIEKRLAALPSGRRYAFGIMPLNSCCSHFHGVEVPDYLVKRLEKGFFVNSTYIPDWNDDFYLERVAKLFEALGKKYDGDPRIVWIDIRLYGNWGEWHLNGFDGMPGRHIPYDDPSFNIHGAQPGSEESKQKIINAQVNAFPHTQLLMIDNAEMLPYALKLNTLMPIGIRRDNFGSLLFEKSFLYANLLPEDRELILNRWKVAPLIVESYRGDKAFEAGPDGLVNQIVDHHVSAIGNGNLGNWEDISPEIQQALQLVGTKAGYIMLLQEIDYPEQLHQGKHFNVMTRLLNVGNAPTYEEWQVVFSLIGVDELPVWSAASKINLKNLIPTSPVVQNDNYQIPVSVPPGTYRLAVNIIDPHHYRHPMNLPLDKPKSASGYVIGKIEVMP